MFLRLSPTVLYGLGFTGQAQSDPFQSPLKPEGPLLDTRMRAFRDRAVKLYCSASSYVCGSRKYGSGVQVYLIHPKLSNLATLITLNP